MDLALEEAVAQILAAVPAPSREDVPIADAHGRVAVENVVSPENLPRFDNSSMDGYAVRAGDVASASLEAPSRLRLIGKATAGELFRGKLAAGECVRIATGSALPEGADAVVMQEDTRMDSDSGTEVTILESVKPWENVRLRGSDTKRGSAIVEAGKSLTAADVGLLIASGVTKISVGRSPVVGLLATGSELKEPGQSLGPGQIYESNRAMLAWLIRRCGGTPGILPLVPDTVEATRDALANAFRNADAVVTTGGASVGEMDFVKRAFEEAGGKLQFWRVAMKPGRPFVFGNWGTKLLFGLPGNPVSAFVTFLLLVRPALMRWQGASIVDLPAHPGVLAESLTNPDVRPHFMRVRVDSDGRIFSAGLQASHAIGSLAAANGLVEVPPHSTLTAGSTARVMRWE